ncbi:uncharacterized protein LOC143018986 isoform X3 [Oratosquilla oratoria]|uniref:uncharacterized protein LOC143018986 isoform X3 n=1 Tax=Oratosquilla oratoria TaxID=337810 RepID=UPI003F7626E2
MRIAPFPYNTTRRSKMACEDCVNLEDHLRMYKEETCLLKNALCEKNESSPQPKQRSTSSTPATAMNGFKGLLAPPDSCYIYGKHIKERGKNSLWKCW